PQCTDGTYRCAAGKSEKCVGGAWQPDNNCATTGCNANTGKCYLGAVTTCTALSPSSCKGSCVSGTWHLTSCAPTPGYENYGNCTVVNGGCRADRIFTTYYMQCKGTGTCY